MEVRLSFSEGISFCFKDLAGNEQILWTDNEVIIFFVYLYRFLRKTSPK